MPNNEVPNDLLSLRELDSEVKPVVFDYGLMMVSQMVVDWE